MSDDCPSCKVLQKIFGDTRTCDNHVADIGDSLLKQLLKSFAELSDKANQALEDGKINAEELHIAHAFFIQALPSIAAAIPASLPGYMNNFYRPEQMLHLTLETFKKGGMQIVSVPVPVKTPETNIQQQN